MRRSRRGGGFHQELGGSGEDSFVAVVVTKLTGALLFILLLTMVIMALVPKADSEQGQASAEAKKSPSLMLDVPETLPEAVVGRSYQFAFSARGESAGALQWSVREALPEGLSFDEKTGRLSGSVHDKGLETVPLTIQVTDGRTVAGAVTQLPVWNPEAEQGAAATSQAFQLSAMPMQAWISQGFGLALVWFGCLAGVGLIDRLEAVQLAGLGGAAPRPRRFQMYRFVTGLCGLCGTCAIVAWMWI